MNVIHVLVGTSGVSLFLLALLALAVKETYQLASLKRHRSKNPGVADLLNYAGLVDNGIVVLKNGSLLSAWEYRGRDTAGLSNPEIEAISRQINRAAKPLGNGWMWHIDAFRKTAPTYIEPERNAFPDPVTRGIDAERRRNFRRPEFLYESRFVLSVTYQLPHGAVRKLGNLLFIDSQEEKSPDAAASQGLNRFKRDLLNLENRLSGTVSLTRLGENGDGTNALLEYLHQCATGRKHPIRTPRQPMLLDALIGGQELVGGTLPRIGRKYVQTVAIEGFPLESHPGILSALSELDLEYRWNSRFIFLDPWEALNHLDRFRRKWKQQIIPFVAQLLRIPAPRKNEDAESMVEDTDEARVEIQSGDVSAGYFTSNVILMGEHRPKLEEEARRVEKTINSLGFGARIETVNTLDAFFGSLPGHGAENVRRPLIHTINLADFLPVNTIWTGEPEAPCPFYQKRQPGAPPLSYAVTTGQTPFALNLHVSEVGDTLIFGPKGSGKSTLLCFLAAQGRRYLDMSTFAFDKDMSMYALCKAAGGTHYQIARDNDQMAFCPLAHLDTHEDRLWAAEWINEIVRLNDVVPTPYQVEQIWGALESLGSGEYRTMTDFLNLLMDKPLRQVLQDYTLKGGMGIVFDAPSDKLEGFGNFCVFEVNTLMQLSPRFALPILRYLFRRIERSLHGQPAMLLLDEAWLLLDHPVFRAKIRDWIKTMRKANCLLVFATQSLVDVTDSGILSALDEGTATKIFLANLSAQAEDAAKLYTRFGLNPNEIEQLSRARPKKDYYMVSEKGRRMIDLNLGPLALAFLGVSDKDTVAAVQRCEREHGKEWIQAWLDRKGVAL